MSDRIFADGSTTAVRQQAVDLIHQARHPVTVTVGQNMVAEDERTADREAQLALAAAMVYLGDIIAADDCDDDKVNIGRWGDQKPTRSTGGDHG